MRERVSKKKKQAKRLILVICEGETEAAYVELLRRHYRLPIEIKSKVAGNKINARLVKQYIHELGVGGKKECEVFYIYDMDVEHLTDALEKLPGKTILTNPCMELWFLLHSMAHSRSLSSEEALRLLSSTPEWAAYRKGKLNTAQQNLLINNIKTAVRNAGELCYPNNPSSNMPKFIAHLENEKQA